MSRWLLAGVAAVVVLARADQALADALADARKAVESSDYPTARTALEKALQAGTAGPAELAEIYKLTGTVEAALGNAQGATAAFSKWLTLDPKASLPFGTSPKIAKPFSAAESRKRGIVEAKAETEDAPPSVTLVVQNDPEKLIVRARVYYRVDKRPEQGKTVDGTGQIKIDLEPGQRIDLRLLGLDQYGNRVIELGTKDVPIVITGSGPTTPVISDKVVVKPRPAEPASPRPVYLQWWLWGVSSAVVASVGGYFAYRTHDEINRLETLNANSYAHTWSEAQGVESDARRDLLITNITLGVAGALAIGTAILYLTRPDVTETEPRAAITPVPGGGAVVLGGRF